MLDEICARLSEGEPLAQICRDAHMPSRSLVWEWRDCDSAISDRIARARELGFDAIAAEVLRIADTPVEGVRKKIDENGQVVEVNSEDMLGHRRLQIDTRLKLLAKWDPKRYGDKVQHSNDPENPMPTASIGVVMIPQKTISGDE